MKKPKENWEEKLKKIQEELTDKIDEYFPKIEPIKGNKGRGEAIVIVGLALAGFRRLLQQERKRVLNLIQEELNDRIKYYEEETLPDMTEYIKGIRDFAQTIINFLKYEKNL